MKRQVVPILLCQMLLLSSCARTPEIVLSGPTMGTTYTVKVVAAPPDVTAARVRRTIDDVLALVDRQMSGYRPDSEISRFNASMSTEWFDVSRELHAVVSAALGIAERSGGAMDITVAPLVTLWGFGPPGEMDSLPDQSQLDAARQRIGYRIVHARAEPPAIRKEHPELSIDLNSVAPGYAADLLVERLDALGVRNCMVEIGGEIRVRGRSRDARPWRIAVEKPVDGASEPYMVVELDEEAVTTSGEYRHSVTRDGERLSHTIDPRTGRPINHDLASVVVIAATALEADGWATALNVLGPERGYELATRVELAAMFIERKEGALVHRATPRFQRYVVAAPPRHES